MSNPPPTFRSDAARGGFMRGWPWNRTAVGNALAGHRPAPGDIRAAWVSALIMLPQAIAFAVMAGLPPEMGIYSSVIPVVVAAVLGPSPRLLSGPNTAVAIMLGAALGPLGVPGSVEYVTYAAALSALVGLLQLAAALGGIGRLLSCLPRFTSTGLSMGIGIAMMSCQAAPALGLLPPPGIPAWIGPWLDAQRWSAINPYAVVVTVVTIAAGQIFTRWSTRWMPGLVAAMLFGAATGWTLDLLLGPTTVHLERIGHLSLHLGRVPFQLPSVSIEDFYVIKQLGVSAVGIAIVASLQSVLILRSLEPDGGSRQCRRELAAQAAANLAAATCGGFACSGSFNRTASHVEAGARTRAAAVLSSLILLGISLVAAPVYAYLSRPAIAGVLVLVGWSMVRSGWKAVRADHGFARWATLALALSVYVVGVQAALALALILAAVPTFFQSPAPSVDGSRHER
ncbi:SulP family inorganic anion transporter [Burkholderia sp. Bp8963]|uniref:SulP family inorganic anion transporter n=1 Tax=Burkholderia sp. Bp8963 TaxID=2184547 RepID=UPI00163980AE|nr:SulP family inorganic anion transporter [Burkholderia sp. Bp8963]